MFNIIINNKLSQYFIIFALETSDEDFALCEPLPHPPLEDKSFLLSPVETLQAGD